MAWGGRAVWFKLSRSGQQFWASLSSTFVGLTRGSGRVGFIVLSYCWKFPCASYFLIMYGYAPERCTGFRYSALQTVGRVRSPFKQVESGAFAKQEAQLSQRGRATLRVVENLAVIRIYAIQWGVCKFLLIFHCNCVSVSYRFWDIQRRIIAALLKSGLGVTEVSSFDRLHTSSDWRSTVNAARSCIVSEIKQQWSKVADFYIPHLHSRPITGDHVEILP